MPDRPRQLAWTMLLAVAAAGLVGCQTGGMTAGDAALAADEGSPGYFDRVSSLPSVSENDALRGMLMLLDGEDSCRTFQERVEALQQRGIVDGGWRFEAGRPLTRGKLAYMVCQASGVPGGVILLVGGPNQRYCLREMQYRGLMSDGDMFNKVTGMEFVAVLTRADTYRRTGELPSVLAAGRR